MGHPVHKIKAFEIVGPYRLRIEFGDGLVRTIDFRPVLEGELYGPLRDLNQFNSVSVDREVHTLVCRTALTLTRPPFTTGPIMRQAWSRSRSVGRPPDTARKPANPLDPYSRFETPPWAVITSPSAWAAKRGRRESTPSARSSSRKANGSALSAWSTTLWRRRRACRNFAGRSNSSSWGTSSSACATGSNHSAISRARPRSTGRCSDSLVWPFPPRCSSSAR